MLDPEGNNTSWSYDLGCAGKRENRQTAGYDKSSRRDVMGNSIQRDEDFEEIGRKRDSNSRPQPWQARIMLYQQDAAVMVLRNWIRVLGERNSKGSKRDWSRETRLELATLTLARSCSTN